MRRRSLYPRELFFSNRSSVDSFARTQGELANVSRDMCIANFLNPVEVERERRTLVNIQTAPIPEPSDSDQASLWAPKLISDRIIKVPARTLFRVMQFNFRGLSIRTRCARLLRRFTVEGRPMREVKQPLASRRREFPPQTYARFSLVADVTRGF